MSTSIATRSTIVAVLMVFLCGMECSAAKKQPFPVATVDAPLAHMPGRETAVLAGGCFWGTQAVFERVKGVLATTAGYAGGSAATATYAQVMTEKTGHAESVRVVFDPSKITYGTLLRIFFSVAHDPTQLNRQGPDIGPSYRSVIFYANPEQERIAKAYIAQLDAAKVFRKPIVTQVVPLQGFYPAEAYHQDYALHNPFNPYVEVCDRPKIGALKKEFPDLFQKYTGK
ncbi:MAG: peptide-methionine (S)-S-oxide reductase MsrA [Acidobacteriaceae bacterium]